MNKFIFLGVASLFILGVTSCKKSSSSVDKSKTDSTKTNPVAPTYYIDYKVNGTAVTDTVLTATRGAASNPRTFTITGAAKTGASINFKFYAEETAIGFSAGLNMESTQFSYPTDYAQYTDTSGVLFYTKNDPAGGGIFFFIQAISYTQGGVMSGKFSGSITNATGAVNQITEGTYNVKFSN